MKSLYPNITEQHLELAKNIKLLICDVDGVFSDGRIYLGNSGEELKAFHTKDGFGIKALVSSGVKVGIITGRRSKLVENRMNALNVNYLVQGEENKLPAFKNMIASANLTSSEVAYIGDDVPDLPCIELAALGVAVHDAHPLVKHSANYITSNLGGFGAVRELCDLIMLSQNTLAMAKGASV